MLSKTKIIFFDSLCSTNEEFLDQYTNDILDFFPYKKKPYKLLYTIYQVDQILYMFKRRYLFDKQCIDIIFNNCQSLTLNFKSIEDFIKVCKQLAELNSKAKAFLSPIKKTKLVEKWKEGKISNSFYIMLLNYYGSRSYNDLSQYPVIPWFINSETFDIPEYEEQKLNIRDFKLNLNKLGGGKRLEQSIQRYHEGDAMTEEKYFSGSHFSNPGIIIQYLVRIPPFLDGLIKFQSGKLDCADRMFSSLISSYNLALTEVGDMRELIPESIILPEMYKNNLKVNFGETQDHTLVDHVILPEWAKGDPYFFTWKFKEYFESRQVGDNIHQWFDLIFGCKQKGEEAIKACNLYPPISYEDGIDLTNPNNIIHKNALIVQAYNYGQWPTQLFHESHISRKIVEDPLIFISQRADLEARPIDLNKQKYGEIKEIKFVNENLFYMLNKKNKIIR